MNSKRIIVLVTRRENKCVGTDGLQPSPLVDVEKRNDSTCCIVTSSSLQSMSNVAALNVDMLFKVLA